MAPQSPSFASREPPPTPSLPLHHPVPRYQPQMIRCFQGVVEKIQQLPESSPSASNTKVFWEVFHNQARGFFVGRARFLRRGSGTKRAPRAPGQVVFFVPHQPPNQAFAPPLGFAMCAVPGWELDPNPNGFSFACFWCSLYLKQRKDPPFHSLKSICFSVGFKGNRFHYWEYLRSFSRNLSKWNRRPRQVACSVWLFG